MFQNPLHAGRLFSSGVGWHFEMQVYSTSLLYSDFMYFLAMFIEGGVNLKLNAACAI